LLILGREFTQDNSITPQYYFLIIHIVFLILGFFGLIKSSAMQTNYLHNFKPSIKITLITISIIIFLWMIN